MIQSLFDKTVFLFGAGASVDADCYSSKNILLDLFEQLNLASNFNHDLKLQQNYLDIYNFVLASLSYQQALKSQNPSFQLDFNIEDFVMVLRQIIDREYLIPAPLIGNWNSKIEALELKKENIFSEFLSFITKLLITRWCSCSPKKASKLMKPFEELTSNPDIKQIDIFSLNYDMVIESAFCKDRENEHIIDNGFSNREWKNSFTSPGSKIQYYKLHGSLNWFFDESSETVKEDDLYDAVDNPLIIFGSSYKMQSYDPFLTLLSRFKEKLSQASIYVIVGYSFHDKYINNIIIQSLSDGNKKAIIVDPSTEEEVAKFVANIENIQNSRSISEIINLTRINESKVLPIKLKAAEFFSKYLGNNADELYKIWEELERSNRPF